MVDLCALNSSKCLNNGKCVVNLALNTTHCQCAWCHFGVLCENDTNEATPFNLIAYAYLIIYFIEFCISIINNGLVLELTIRCRRIRKTNSGIYLMIYSILSLLSSIVILVHQAVRYYPNQLTTDYKHYELFRCYGSKIAHSVLLALCVFLSSCIAFEHGLIIWRERKMHASQWRSCITIIVLFGMTLATGTPIGVNKCNFSVLSFDLRSFISWFYMSTGIVIYMVATLLVLITFTSRIRRYGMENNSWIKTFLKLLYTHLFIFVPPITYGIFQIPYTIALHTKAPKTVYLSCDISREKLIVRLIIHTVAHVPFVITWLIFVYPSRVYMTEFYLNTWSGQRLANIILLFKSFTNKNKMKHFLDTKSTDGENPEWKNQDLRTLEVPRMCERIRRSTQRYIVINYNDIHAEQYKCFRK